MGENPTKGEQIILGCGKGINAWIRSEVEVLNASLSADLARQLRYLQIVGLQHLCVVDLKKRKLTVTKHQLVSF